MRRRKARVEADPQALVREWHLKFGVHAATLPSVPPLGVRDLRIELIREELEEFSNASKLGDIVGVADAIADLLYVVYGAAVAWGIPAGTKVWVDGSVHRRDDGKVLKPPTYSPANLKPILDAELARLRGEGRQG